MTEITTLLQFHTGILPEYDVSSNMFTYPVLFSEDEQYHFGTLDISTSASDPIPYIWDVKFSIDNSGSMSDKCQDGRTKLQHITHTLCNIIRLFASYKSMTFNVCIHTFNDTTTKIIDFTEISNDTIDAIIAKISTIYDIGSTNLLNPITETTEQMTERACLFPNNKQIHFLMTDGIDSCDNSPDTIVDAVQSTYETVVFGFGIDHDSYTLMRIGDKPKCSYGFIAEIEKAGIIYGEYIHNILYRVCTDISIELRSAEIYSWKTNTWENILCIDSLASDLKKTFYVRTQTDPQEITGELRGCMCQLDGNAQCTILLDTIDTLPDLLDLSGEPFIIDLVDHMFRYKTLELLYEANSIDIQNNTSGFWQHPTSKKSKSTIIGIRRKLLNLYKNMRAYITARYPQGSPFMENLLDDIYVSGLSFETANMRIYSLSRHRTQGNQNVYTPTNINNYVDDTIRGSKYDNTDDDDNTDDSDDGNNILCVLPDTECSFSNHTMSQLSQDVYTSPTLQQVIRSTTDNEY